MDSLIPQLLDMFPEEMTVEPRTGSTQFGEGIFGASFIVRIRVSGKIVTVMGLDGVEHVSNLHVAVAGVYVMSVADRFTLPLHYSTNPRNASDLRARQPKAVAITTTSDEHGPHHQKVYFK